MILLDTNAFIWWVSDRSKLTKKALNAITKDNKNKPLLVSTISIWEICLLATKKRINLHTSLGKWTDELDRLPDIEFVPVDKEIAYQATQLPGSFHNDPADRFITATALILGADIITSDLKIRRYKHVKTIW